MKKKYIIALTSGLGNQMSQYALYEYIKLKTQNDCLLYTYNKHLTQHNGFELTRIFNNINPVKHNNILLFCYVELFLFFEKIITAMAYKLKSKLINKLIKLFPYQVIIFPTWSNYLFIKDIISVLQNKKFVFPDLQLEKDIDLYRKIKLSNSVSIHVRRGDYISHPLWKCILGDVCTSQYYNCAIKYIQEKIETPLFVVFSDDISWCKDTFDLKNVIYVDWNSGELSFRDMQFMALCKHNIIANSTFSLWGAWLNSNPDKIVLVPSKWHNVYKDITCSKYVPCDWIKIDNVLPNISLIFNCKLTSKEIENILTQSYSDFELLFYFDGNVNSLQDDRIKDLFFNKPKGNYKFDFSDQDISKFRNRKYLYNMLYDHFKKNTDM